MLFNDTNQKNQFSDEKAKNMGKKSFSHLFSGSFSIAVDSV